MSASSDLVVLFKDGHLIAARRKQSSARQASEARADDYIINFFRCSCGGGAPRCGASERRTWNKSQRARAPHGGKGRHYSALGPCYTSPNKHSTRGER